MAVDIFLKIDGITGEARDRKHEGAIDVLGWSWGITAKINRAGGGPVQSPDVEHLIVTKYVDRASAALMTALLRSQPIKSATMICRKAGGQAPLEYLKIEMSDVRIASVKPVGLSTDERFTEELVLDFSKVLFSYQEQDEKGIGKGGVVEFEHIIRGGK